MKSAPPARKPSGVDGHDGNGAPPVSADDLAAQLFGEDEPKPAAEKAPAPGTPIKHKCFFCEEEAEYPFELAGKQTPCLHCKRIIKIPLPVSDKPKDWRDVEKLPSLAKRDFGEIEDAWGTDVRATVDQSTLEEAGVEAPKPKAPLPQRIKRWASIVAGVAGGLLLVYYGLTFRKTRTQTSAIVRAVDYLEKDQKGPKLIPPEAAAEVYRGAGEYYVREKTPDDTLAAVKHFKQAHSNLLSARKVNIDRDMAFMDLVVAESELGGTAEEILNRTRLNWKDLRDLMRPSLGRIQYPEVRAETARRLARRLLGRVKKSPDREQVGREVEGLIGLMAGTPDEKPELLARVGLELLLLGETAAAERVAENAFSLYKVDKRPPVAPSLIALLVALDKGKQANELVAPPTTQGVFPVESRVGHVLARAIKNNWEDAAKLAGQDNGEQGDRMAAYLALAELSVVTKPDATAGLVDEAFKAVKAPRVTPWMQFLLIRAGGRAGKAKDMESFARTTFTGKETQPLLQRALLEAMRGDLLSRKGQAATTEMQAEADKREQGYAPMLVLLARHNARYGSAPDADKWQPEAIRSLGLIGVALGMKDRDGDLPQEAVAKTK